jgi:hypothetical protein
MENMEFELRGEVFYVQSVMARQVCDVLARNPGTLRWAVEVTNENVDDLWGGPATNFSSGPDDGNGYHERAE